AGVEAWPGEDVHHRRCRPGPRLLEDPLARPGMPSVHDQTGLPPRAGRWPQPPGGGRVHAGLEQERSLMPDGQRGNRRRLSLRNALLLTVAVSAALLSVIVYATGALNGLERQTIDTRFGIRGREGPGSKVAIVAVDQKSLRSIDERLPIRRSLYARLLDQLK